jgi:hypothetical protein
MSLCIWLRTICLSDTNTAVLCADGGNVLTNPPKSQQEIRVAKQAKNRTTQWANLDNANASGCKPMTNVYPECRMTLQKNSRMWKDQKVGLFELRG